MGLARSSLSIGENGAIVALKESMTHLQADFVEYFLLVDKLSEYFIKTKIIFLYFYSLFIKNLYKILLQLLL